MGVSYLNFNLLILISVLMLGGCGVKSKPAQREGTAIQSYTNSYLDKESENKPPVPVK